VKDSRPVSHFISASLFLAFFIYSAYFLLIYGNRLNTDMMNNGLRSFWPGMEAWVWTSYFAAAAYIIFISCLFFSKGHPAQHAATPLKFCAYIFFASFIIRAIPAGFIFGPDTDIVVFQKARQMALNGNWCGIREIMPYYLFEQYMLYLTSLADKFLNMPGYFSVKLPGILFDSLIPVIIHKLTGSRDHSVKYALNPVSVMVSAYHGMFDAVTIFFLLLCFYLIIKNKNLFLQGAAYGLAFQSKPWPALFSPSVFLRMKPAQVLCFLSGALLTFIVFSFICLGSPGYVLGPLSYSGISGFGQVTGVLYILLDRMLHAHAAYNASLLAVKIVFIAVILWSAYISRAWGVMEAFYLFLLGFYVFSPGFSQQYNLWLMPFIIIFNDETGPLMKSLLVYVAAVYFTHILYPLSGPVHIMNRDLRQIFIFLSIIPWWFAFNRWREMIKNKGTNRP